jgi:HEPN domain-containing protein
MSGPRPVDPHQWEEVERWLNRILDDLSMVDAALAQPSPSVYGASLHCQQAAEKIAKAVLIAFSVKPPRIHDLQQLGELLETVHPAIGMEIQDLAQLTSWYTAARYPDVLSDAQPSLQEIRSALTVLRALYDRVMALAPGE